MEKEENKGYIEKLEQFLDSCKEEDMIYIYEKAMFKVIDYLEKSN